MEAAMLLRCTTLRDITLHFCRETISEEPFSLVALADTNDNDGAITEGQRAVLTPIIWHSPLSTGFIRKISQKAGIWSRVLLEVVGSASANSWTRPISLVQY